jgi:3-oxoacyl-[acyl-carrier protein] reductase
VKLVVIRLYNVPVRNRTFLDIREVIKRDKTKHGYRKELRMSQILKDKVAVITGASRGLGKEFAKRFVEEGAKLLLTTTSMERAAETVKELKAKGGEVAVIEADISVAADTQKIADTVIKEYGKVDILVNNAAIWYGIRMKPWDMWSEEDWDRIFAVNVKGTWMVCLSSCPMPAARVLFTR